LAEMAWAFRRWPAVAAAMPSAAPLLAAGAAYGSSLSPSSCAVVGGEELERQWRSLKLKLQAGSGSAGCQPARERSERIARFHAPRRVAGVRRPGPTGRLAAGAPALFATPSGSRRTSGAAPRSLSPYRAPEPRPLSRTLRAAPEARSPEPAPSAARRPLSFI
jgi:hypothetical protein